MTITCYNRGMLSFINKAFRIPQRLHFVKSGDWSDRSRPVVVLLHGIAASAEKWRYLTEILGDQPTIAVDLLGFGVSGKPDWPEYTLRDHARSVNQTLRRQALGRRYIICGHSLGSLVGIEYSRLRYRSVDRLVLCSPPIYHLSKAKAESLKEAVLKELSYKLQFKNKDTPELAMASRYYQQLQAIAPFDEETMLSFLKTAKNSILFQTTYHDLLELPDMPVDIIYGTLDLFMAPKNLERIAKRRKNATITTLLVGHDINKKYSRAIAKIIL